METSDIVPELKRTEELDRPFSLCGRRCYLIGFQNGLFPDYGRNRIGEMGGIWTHPIKIADGFWVSIETEGQEGPHGYAFSNRVYKHNMRHWLSRCDEFILGDGGAWVEHRYNLPDFLVKRREFIPYEEPAVGIDIHVSAKTESIKTAQLNFLVRFDLLSVFFSGWPDPVYLEAETKNNIVVVHATSGEHLPFTYGRWTAVLGSDIPPDSVALGEKLWGPETTFGNGISCLLKFPLNLNPDARIRLVLTGDCEGETGAIDVLNRVLPRYNASLQKKVQRYNHVAHDLTVVETPEKLLNDAFLWSKLNLEWLTQTSSYMKMRLGDDWHVYSSPYVGTCVVAGHQDYPLYFGGDTEVSIPGILAAGLHETAKESLKLLGAVGKSQNGRIPHCTVTNGEIYDWGNIHESTLFARAVWETYLWSGDEDFLQEMYPICRMAMLDYALQQPRQDGFLLMETGDNPDSSRAKACPSYIVWGIEAFAKMAERMEDYSTFEKCKFEAETMKRQIEYFWVEEQGLYANLLDENNKPVSDHQNQFWSYMHASIIAAYCNLADKSRIAKALAKIEAPPYTSEWGIYLAPGADYMPFTMGKAAIAEFNYGRQEQGLRFLRMMAKTVGHIMPGAVPETFHKSGDAAKFLPGWCYLQLWSASHITQGLVWGLLRVEPDAARKMVRITPKLPKDWSYAEIKNITIGDSRISIRLEKGKTQVTHIDGPKLEIQQL